MANPSKAGAIFLFVFGLPFFGFGLFAAFAFLSSSPAIHKTGNPVAGALFASVFALIGAGFMFGAVYGYGQQKREAAAAEANPDSPWLWRTDWAASRALSKSRNTVYTWWVGTALVSMIVLPIVYTSLPELLRNSDPKALILVGLCLFPLILLAGALRATIRRERFGQTCFEFASLPFSPGKRMTGQIQLRLRTEVAHGIDLRISCIRRIVTGSGKQQTTNEAVLWQNQKNVPQSSLIFGPMGTSIPVEFQIPEDAYETNHDQPSDQLLWMLHAQADVPGVDYSDDFEVPVFRLTPRAVPLASPDTNFAATVSPILGSTAAAAAPAFQSDSSDVQAPPNPKVAVSITSDGSTEFYFPPFRNRIQTFALFLFTVIWTGVVYFLWQSKAPWFFAPIFGLFDVLLIYGCLQSAFGSIRIVVGNGKLAVRRELFGAGAPREIPFREIQSVMATVGLQQSTGGRNASHMVRLRTKDGKSLTLADNILDRQEARWIVAQIEKLAGLKTDTHVTLADSFGNPLSPPPQRDSFATAAAGASGAGIASTQLKSSRGGLIAACMFVASVGFAIHTFLGPRHSIVSRGSYSPARAAVSGRRTTQRVVYAAALTDEDEQRLHTMTPQAQAEELLERALQHDSRALELFEQNIWTSEWLGRIKLSDRMKQLERRTQFSSDLRVRYANADLNLSMDGWQKTDQSADLLIERARRDPQYRAAAVYFLGMLAGRGVAYERIHPVLLDYAKHNPIQTVRLWAVEGMRYLETDEALDELFDSFTHDSSMQVRDRAGCNVSDCGNFKRAQRMRMVPKVLALASDGSASAQMRNWAFLALREITDQNLPNDVTAWQNWYSQHGAEKLAQFESQEWWRVRGDE